MEAVAVVVVVVLVVAVVAVVAADLTCWKRGRKRHSLAGKAQGPKGVGTVAQNCLIRSPGKERRSAHNPTLIGMCVCVSCFEIKPHQMQTVFREGASGIQSTAEQRGRERK